MYNLTDPTYMEDMDNFTTVATTIDACNGTTKPPAPLPGHETMIATLMPTLCAIVMLIGIIGNTLVIIAVVVNKHMRSATNFLITNLAIADLMFLAIVCPFSAYRWANPGWGSDTACKVVLYFQYSTAWASIYTLVLMSIIRYIAIVFPIMSLKFLHSLKNITLVIITMWAFVFSVNIPSYMFHGTLSYTHKCQHRTICMFTQYSKVNFTAVPELTRRKQIFHLCFLVFGFIMPLLIISVLYTFILRALTAGGAIIRESQTRENQRSKKRAARMVFAVVLAFAICWLPLQLVLITSAYGLEPGMEMNTFSNVLAFINSCLNPILYAFLSVNFRQNFMKILCCNKKAKKRLASTTEISMAPMEDSKLCS